MKAGSRNATSLALSNDIPKISYLISCSRKPSGRASMTPMREPLQTPQTKATQRALSGFLTPKPTITSPHWAGTTKGLGLRTQVFESGRINYRGAAVVGAHNGVTVTPTSLSLPWWRTNRERGARKHKTSIAKCACRSAWGHMVIATKQSLRAMMSACNPSRA
eukprot:CAMPEP_0198215788 /NCGR_PEP_ID=MMETSP1445-20131203/52712_1 /TAXON_ID=36898 /ORGANISM="Pyramimonas sp., Strain CCMP2087" /LENGTH=162 /DNA_ID=CAMNT_0043891691 /DNA_START=208 /DNA_END=693 /DNA_ORIENTATION=+